MGTKSDGQVEVDDNGYVMGSSEKGAYFRVHASKSETDHNLGTVAKLAMRQPFVLFKGLTFQKLCLPGAFRPGD
ncbi:hypothetical protein ODQ46_21155, partial [Escherichia coli]|nr:hypothetical protein [Escherichia coli]